VTALQRRETLTSQLIRSLTEWIVTGRIKPGGKLPSEQELIGKFNVSRTVVREAISSLRAAGLVTTQQGVGAFVLQAPAEPFRIDESSLDLLKEIVSVLELRIALETEAAALAAQRRRPEHVREMRAALDRMEAAIAASEDAVASDLDFHRLIAESTGNPHFIHLFNYLGALMIPRTRVQTFRLFADDRTEYLLRVNREHEDIYQAIARQESDAARSAMRLHLSNSRERLRRAMERTLQPSGVA
jgi:GntR family transcriptional repressor for pyruvate dehydrogenase complex